MKRVVYDTGVLIAADRSERRTWAEHRVRLEAGVIPRWYLHGGCTGEPLPKASCTNASAPTSGL